MLCSSSYLIYAPFIFPRPSNSNINESLLLLSEYLWKLKAKYLVLCLNALANFQNASIVSRYPALMSNYPSCSHVS